MRSIKTVCIFAFLAPALAWGAPSCSGRDVVLNNSLATASTFANVTGADGSIKKESGKLLTQAVDGVREAKQPDSVCSADCNVNPSPFIFLRSVPNKFLSDYSDKAECDKFETETTDKPIFYGNLHFNSLAELNDWFGDFSQGKGKEGKDLYNRCPGSCSPRYTNIIRPSENGFDVEAEVVCGAARDKSDNQYQLSAGYHWACLSKETF